MGLRINTNVAAQYSVYNLVNTNNKLSQSLNRLSTGLRITKAADDAAGMTIADGLQFQSKNLGQAISNGNNAIKLIQIADMALQKSIDIVQTIAQKATQAANATEDPASRKAIQAEINKLIQEVNNIAETTSYKDTKLLDGTFTNRIVHIGAYMNQTLSIGAQRTAADSIGWVANGTITNSNGWFNSEQKASNTSNNTLTYNANTHLVELVDNDLTINGVAVGQDAAGINRNQQIDAKTFAAAINAVQLQTGGVEAEAKTTVTGNAAITAGVINAGDLWINGVNIGQVNVGANDANGALVEAINKYTDQTGVVASVDNQGKLVLTAEDGRNIAVEVNGNAGNITGLSTQETTVQGTVSTISTNFNFYLNGIQITLDANVKATSAVQSINQQLAAAGVDTDKIFAVKAPGGSHGYVKLVVRDGEDLNIYVASGQAKASHLTFIGLASVTKNHDTYYLANNSHHGTITLTNTDNITIGGNDTGVAGLGSGVIAPTKRLQDVDVTTTKGAELAIKIAQSALSDLDKVRSNLGAIQNQIQATVENISITQININGAESTIRDVNFAQESSNFSKLQILAQSGTYALAQANAVQQNVLRLLQ
ncbi:flagellin N-terminal helical domain-containing protein [Hippea jasoniae]|uniref:flagellin N-terminal helical domain-containing protein n=1 Tax=Hippea jasoniae TaxID=944479 RepID=UPI00054EA342|nr:flagellin [Hippea jasoniae]